MTLTKRWYKHHESAFRRRVHIVLHDIEVDFDPDRDWEEANIEHKKFGGEMGTKLGYSMEPNPDDSQSDIDSFKELLRK